MKYMGSKNRIAKHLLPIILKDRKPWQWYVEPFVGGANMIDKVEWNRIGADYNSYNIVLFQALQNWFIPPKYVSEEKYKYFQDSDKITPEKSFVWYNCSYWAKFFWWYARWNNNKWVKRNYCLEWYNNIMEQLPNIQWVKFINSSYKDLEIPKESIIYCDPPYKDTTKYKTWWFDYEHFYNWCREKKKEWHTIFISEYDMPDDFKCVWQQEIVNNLNNKKATEKLFTI
jgi:DNA adenine methylase